jgi:hypothetical protein
MGPSPGERRFSIYVKSTSDTSTNESGQKSTNRIHARLTRAAALTARSQGSHIVTERTDDAGNTSSSRLFFLRATRRRRRSCGSLTRSA